MVLGDDVDNRLRKMHLMRPLDAFFYVVADYRNGKARIYVIVFIAFFLVFDKIFGLFEFSRIVIIRADARQKSVCADRRTRVFRQSCNEHGMVVSSGRRQKHTFHKRIVQIGQIHKAEHRRRIQQEFQRRQ